MRGFTKIFSLLLIGASLVLPAGAIAQSAETGYAQPGGVVQDQIETQPAEDSGNTPAAATEPAPEAASDEGGSLPFTGLDVALVVGAGGVLLLLGFGIRRLTSASELA
jgi:hypothetical protein